LMGCGWGVDLWYAGAGGLNPPVMGPSAEQRRGQWASGWFLAKDLRS
jgi:hypothetical protein